MKQIILLGLLVFTGLLLASWHKPEFEQFLKWGQLIADLPLAVMAIVALMVVLLTFGLPGNMVFWVIAPFHPPPVAVMILLFGSVSGAFGAHWFLQRVKKRWPPGKSTQRVVDLLKQRGGLFSQITLRLLPGVPHSVVNYAGGALGLPLGPFLLATFLGLGVKWAVYTTAVHGAMEAIAAGEALQPRAVLPLFVLVGLLLLGALVRRGLKTPSSARD